MRDWSAVGDKWPERNRAVAALVLPGESVLDIGAGAQGLRDLLDLSCAYTPADVCPQSDDCVLLDIDSDEWPEGHWDVITMVGVLEYSTDPGYVLWRARALASRMIVTYWHRRKWQGRPCAHCEPLSQDMFPRVAEAEGWHAEKTAVLRGKGFNRQVLWVLT